METQTFLMKVYYNSPGKPAIQYLLFSNNSQLSVIYGFLKQDGVTCYSSALILSTPSLLLWTWYWRKLVPSPADKSQLLQVSQVTWSIPSKVFYSTFLRCHIKTLFQMLLLIGSEWCSELAIKMWKLKPPETHKVRFLFHITEI